MRHWQLGPGMARRGEAVGCFNQPLNPITSVQLLWPLGVSASSGSVRLYHLPTATKLRMFRFAAQVFQLSMDNMQFITSHQVISDAERDAAKTHFHRMGP